MAAEDPNFTNPFMFTGRRFDFETGLYYYRARYYNPYIGRFLQTDPVGYDNGMNWYAYCGNNPVRFVDPFGLWTLAFYDPDDDGLLIERANDFTVFVPMHSKNDVLNWFIFDFEKAKTIYGPDLEGVYFFDHCSGSFKTRDSSPLGLEFGNDVAYLNESEEFWGQLGDLLPEETVIHFRHCLVAKNKIKFRNLAVWTNRTITGAEGLVYGYGEEHPGPDYYYKYGNVWKCKPNENETLFWDISNDEWVNGMAMPNPQRPY